MRESESLERESCWETVVGVAVAAELAIVVVVVVAAAAVVVAIGGVVGVVGVVVGVEDGRKVLLVALKTFWREDWGWSW